MLSLNWNEDYFCGQFMWIFTTFPSVVMLPGNATLHLLTRNVLYHTAKRTSNVVAIRTLYVLRWVWMLVILRLRFLAAYFVALIETNLVMVYWCTQWTITVHCQVQIALIHQLTLICIWFTSHYPLCTRSIKLWNAWRFYLHYYLNTKQ